MPIINWAKTHKLIVALFLVIAFLLFRNNIVLPQTSSRNLPPAKNFTGTGDLSEISPRSLSTAPQEEISKVSESKDRIVIQTSNLSLLVGDVRKVGDEIVSYAKNIGGFMVTTSYTKPDVSPFATITVRVPTEKLDEALAHFRQLAIKVTSENLVGTDVTEEYTDIEARLDTLQKTKTKFEGILEKAQSVSDILEVQRELINLQEQIDSLKGQKEALEKGANLTKITLYLSTDELALPYTPDKVFRPNVIFKSAVRSLINTLQAIGGILIWVGVFAVIWVPLLIIYLLYKRARGKRSKAQSGPS